MTSPGYPSYHPEFEKSGGTYPTGSPTDPGPYGAPPVWGPPGYAYPTPVAPPQSVRGLAMATRILLSVTAAVDVLQVWRISEQRSLLQALRDDPGSVTREQANAADNAVAGLLILSLAVLLATGIVWIIWLWRMRTNADAWGGRYQRRSKGWVVGGWFCPIVNLWFPYMIMRDVWDETERAPADLAHTRPRRPLLLTWWLVWIVSNISVYVTRGDRDTISELITKTDMEIGSTTLDIVAAALAIVVVARMTRAQDTRLAATTSWAG